MPSLLGSFSMEYGHEALRALDFGVVEPTTHEALDRIDRVAGVGDGLALGELADEPLTGLGERDDRGDRPAAFGGCDDGRLAALHDGHDGVRGAEVDADDLAHVVWWLLVSAGVRWDRCRWWWVPPRRPRGPGAGRGRAVDSRDGRSRRSRLRAGRCRGRRRWPRVRADRRRCPGAASMGVTPSLSSRTRSLRSMAAMPSNQGSSAIDAGRASMARSKSSARFRTLRMRSSAASPRSRSRSSAVRRLKLRNSARSRWRATR